MKYIFSIHSPITFLSAHAVIQLEQLNPADVLLMSNKYRPPIDTYRVAPYLQNLTPGFVSKLRHLNMPVAQDRYLRSLIGDEPFIFYADMMHYDQAVLFTNARCAGLRFIEEGAFAYRRYETHHTLTHAWRTEQYPLRIEGFTARCRHVALAARWAIRGYSQSLLATPTSYNAYHHVKDVRYYGFSEYTFPNVPDEKRVVLKNATSLPAIDEMAAGIKLQDTFIWVDGARGEFTGVPDSVYHRAIEKAIDLFRDELQAKGVAVKLRGKDRPEDNYLYQTLKRHGFNVTLLPGNLVLECVFMNARNCKVIGNVSPALMYANMFGQTAYTIYSLYEERKPSLLDDLPGFWRFVEQLQT
jgi:hypothetical protein